MGMEVALDRLIAVLTDYDIKYVSKRFFDIMFWKGTCIGTCLNKV